MRLIEIVTKPKFNFGPIRVKVKDEIAKFNDELKKNRFVFYLDHDHKTNEGLFMFPTKQEYQAAVKFQQEMIMKDGAFTNVDDKI